MAYRNLVAANSIYPYRPLSRGPTVIRLKNKYENARNINACLATGNVRPGTVKLISSILSIHNRTGNRLHMGSIFSFHSAQLPALIVALCHTNRYPLIPSQNLFLFPLLLGLK